MNFDWIAGARRAFGRHLLASPGKYALHPDESGCCFWLMLQAPVRFSRTGSPSVHANLSSMLTALPTGLRADNSEVEIPQSGASSAESPVEHLCQICPTCGSRLSGHRCKLICNCCGYFMSCADYY